MSISQNFADFRMASWVLFWFGFLIIPLAYIRDSHVKNYRRERRKKKRTYYEQIFQYTITLLGCKYLPVSQYYEVSHHIPPNSDSQNQCVVIFVQMQFKRTFIKIYWNWARSGYWGSIRSQIKIFRKQFWYK